MASYIGFATKSMQPHVMALQVGHQVESKATGREEIMLGRHGMKLE
jgi:hypothetical protein